MPPPEYTERGKYLTNLKNWKNIPGQNQEQEEDPDPFDEAVYEIRVIINEHSRVYRQLETLRNFSMPELFEDKRSRYSSTRVLKDESYFARNGEYQQRLRHRDSERHSVTSYLKNNVDPRRKYYGSRPRSASCASAGDYRPGDRSNMTKGWTGALENSHARTWAMEGRSGNKNMVTVKNVAPSGSQVVGSNGLVRSMSEQYMRLFKSGEQQDEETGKGAGTSTKGSGKKGSTIGFNRSKATDLDNATATNAQTLKEDNSPEKQRPASAGSQTVVRIRSKKQKHGSTQFDLQQHNQCFRQEIDRDMLRGGQPDSCSNNDVPKHSANPNLHFSSSRRPVYTSLNPQKPSDNVHTFAPYITLGWFQCKSSVDERRKLMTIEDWLSRWCDAEDKTLLKDGRLGATMQELRSSQKSLQTLNARGKRHAFQKEFYTDKWFRIYVGACEDNVDTMRLQGSGELCGGNEWNANMPMVGLPFRNIAGNSFLKCSFRGNHGNTQVNNSSSRARSVSFQDDRNNIGDTANVISAQAQSQFVNPRNSYESAQVSDSRLYVEQELARGTYRYLVDASDGARLQLRELEKTLPGLKLVQPRNLVMHMSFASNYYPGAAESAFGGDSCDIDTVLGHYGMAVHADRSKQQIVCNNDSSGNVGSHPNEMALKHHWDDVAVLKVKRKRCMKMWEFQGREDLVMDG